MSLILLHPTCHHQTHLLAHPVQRPSWFLSVCVGQAFEAFHIVQMTTIWFPNFVFYFFLSYTFIYPPLNPGSVRFTLSPLQEWLWYLWVLGSAMSHQKRSVRGLLRWYQIPLDLFIISPSFCACRGPGAGFSWTSDEGQKPRPLFQLIRTNSEVWFVLKRSLSGSAWDWHLAESTPCPLLYPCLASQVPLLVPPGSI